MLKTIQYLITLFAVIFWVKVFIFAIAAPFEIFEHGYAAANFAAAWKVSAILALVFGTVVWLGSDDKNMFT